jgi:hypothetical protein
MQRAARENGSSNFVIHAPDAVLRILEISASSIEIIAPCVESLYLATVSLSKLLLGIRSSRAANPELP